MFTKQPLSTDKRLELEASERELSTERVVVKDSRVLLDTAAPIYVQPLILLTGPLVTSDLGL